MCPPGPVSPWGTPQQPSEIQAFQRENRVSPGSRPYLPRCCVLGRVFPAALLLRAVHTGEQQRLIIQSWDSATTTAQGRPRNGRAWSFYVCLYVNCYYIHTYACNVNILCEIYVDLLNYVLCIESFIEKRLRGCPEGVGNLGSQQEVGYSR